MRLLIFTVLVTLLSVNLAEASKSPQVEFRNNVNERKVDVFVDGKFFTAYIYPDDMEKQVLYPIVSASGKTITRGFPIDPRPFERADHPHHVGLWFNFGDVNGLDFWNNSFAIKPEIKSKYGSIKFIKLVSQDPQKGQLVTHSAWLDQEGNVLLNEETTYRFSGGENLRTIERRSELTAAMRVVFNENKEGLLGLRVDRAFEEPAAKAGNFLDANGEETKTPILNNDGVNGVYRNAEGIQGGDVWGKRSPWVALRAKKDGELITIVLLDHPENENYPAWSHARGYGLFATNNLGGRGVDKRADPVKVVLKPGERITFKHKLVIGGDLTDAEIDRMAGDFN
jgi:hypothetical protein